MKVRVAEEKVWVSTAGIMPPTSPWFWYDWYLDRVTSDKRQNAYRYRHASRMIIHMRGANIRQKGMALRALSRVKPDYVRYGRRGYAIFYTPFRA